jgi:hypothetical protein
MEALPLDQEIDEEYRQSIAVVKETLGVSCTLLLFSLVPFPSCLPSLSRPVPATQLL